jgi:hypothetical protein
VKKEQLHKRMAPHVAWQVIGEFDAKAIGVEAACRWLGISRSRLYELAKRWKETTPTEANKGWLYTRPGSGRWQLPEVIQDFLREELRYLKSESEFFRGHFNFAFLADECYRKFRKRVHRNSLRRWAIRQGLYVPDVDTTAKAYVRFEKGAIGMLFQHDSSIHVWVPYTKRYDVMILTIDDHSRKVVGCRLVPHDTSWNHLCLMRDTIETVGRPLAYYTDNHLLFNPANNAYAQIGRALKTLDIDLKFTAKAHPEAKGKVEKRFDYFQRRIPFLCERYKVKNLTQANKILDEQVAYFNEHHVHEETGERPNHRWKKAEEEGRSSLRPIPPKIPLDIVFALHYKRHFKKDGTVWFAGQRWAVPKAPRWAEATLVLRPPTSERQPHTELFVLHNGSTLRHIVLPTRQRLSPPSI